MKLYSIIFAAFLLSTSISSNEQASAMAFASESSDDAEVKTLATSVTSYDELSDDAQIQAKKTGVSAFFAEEKKFFSSVKSFVSKAFKKVVAFFGF